MNIAESDVAVDSSNPLMIPADEMEAGIEEKCGSGALGKMVLSCTAFSGRKGQCSIGWSF